MFRTNAKGGGTLVMKMELQGNGATFPFIGKLVSRSRLAIDLELTIDEPASIGRSGSAPQPTGFGFLYFRPKTSSDFFGRLVKAMVMPLKKALRLTLAIIQAANCFLDSLGLLSATALTEADGDGRMVLHRKLLLSLPRLRLLQQRGGFYWSHYSTSQRRVIP